MTDRILNRKRDGQQGSAMILALVLLIASTVMALGGFLSVSRNQRVEQRATDRIELYWLAESAFEMTTVSVKDYVKTNTKQPEFYNAGTVAVPEYMICKTAVGTAGTSCDADGSYQDFLKDRFKTTHGVKDSTAAENPSENQLVSFKLALTGYPGSVPEVTDAWRKYTVTVILRNKNSLQTVKFSHSFKVATYSIYDYAVFYNQDLEMAFGPNATINGPIFSNKDIYLMTDAGSTLTLKQGAAGKSILESAGVLYFYFKRAWGYNYMHEPLETKNDSGQITPAADYDAKKAVLDDLEFGLDIKPVHSDIRDYYNRATSLARYRKYAYSDEKGVENNDGLVERAFSFHYNIDAAYSEMLFYHFSNGAERTRTGEVNPRFQFSRLNDSEIQTVELPNSVIGRADISYPAWPPQETPGGFAQLTSRYDYTPSGSQPALNLSTAYQVPENFSDLAVSKKPPRHPNWQNNLAEGLVKDGRPSKDLPFPDALKDFPRLLIEPFTTGSQVTGKYGSLDDDTDIDGADTAIADTVLPRLLINQADVIIDCSSDACLTPQTPNTSGSPRGITVTGLDVSYPSFVDKRLGSAPIKTVQLDFTNFSYEANTAPAANPPGGGYDPTRTIRPDDGLIIYVKTCSVDPVTHTGCDGKIRVLKITGASKALSSGTVVLGPGTAEVTSIPKGYTIATNGRMWVEGDFNTAPVSGSYSDDDGDGELDIVSAALFSDSFGALFPESGGTISQNTLTLNTAVLTGSIPSTLEGRDCGGPASTLTTYPASCVLFGNDQGPFGEWGANREFAGSGLDRFSGYVRGYTGLQNDCNKTGGDCPSPKNYPTDLLYSGYADGYWPVVALWDPDIESGALNNNEHKVIPTLRLPGLHSVVLTNAGNYSVGTRNVTGCQRNYFLNFHQGIQGGEAAGQIVLRTDYMACWGATSASSRSYYDNPDRFRPNSEGLTANVFAKPVCSNNNWWGGYDCDVTYGSGIPGLKRYLYGSDGVQWFKQDNMENRIEPKLDNPGNIGKFKETTGFYHASLGDYAVTVPSGTPSDYKLFYDDDSITGPDANNVIKITGTILACTVTDPASSGSAGAATPSQCYEITPSTTGAATLTSVTTPSGLIPYIGMKSCNNNLSSACDTPYYPVYHLDTGTNRTATPYFDLYYDARPEYFLFRDETKRHSYNGADYNMYFYGIFFWKGAGAAELLAESLSGSAPNNDPCGANIAIIENNSANARVKVGAGANLCIDDGTGNKKINYYYAKPWNVAHTNRRIFYYHGRYYPLYYPRYSGGLEYVLNLQQELQGKTLATYGSIANMWDSEELRKNDGLLAYYDTAIYKAPDRVWKYNPSLSGNSPPGSPSLYGLERGAVKEESLEG